MKYLSGLFKFLSSNTFNKVIKSFIEIFVLTDIWIYGYIYLLSYLNNKYPTIVNDLFLPEVKPYLSPEPFEIPLYLSLTFLLVLFAYFYHFKFKIILEKLLNFSICSKFVLIKYPVLFILIILFIAHLGNYPMKTVASVFNGTYLLYLISILFIMMIIPIFHYFYIGIKNNLVRLSIYPFIVFVIALFTFQPKFPMSPYDYSYFFGPISEIINGKTIYTDIMSQYGFLYVLAFAFFTGSGIFKMTDLINIVWLLYMIQYGLLFYLFYRISKSAVFSVLGLFSVITLNFFSLMHSPIALPQVGPLRWLQMILVIFLFFKIKKIDSKLFIFFTSLLSFLVVDVGIAIIFSYLFTLFIFYLKKTLFLMQIIKSVCYLLISIILIYFSINTLHILIGFKAIDMILYFRKFSQYSREGFGMLPMSNDTYFFFVILIYFSSLIYFIRKKSIDLSDKIVMLSSNISLFASIYFVGRSHPHNLFNISLIVLLNLFIFLGVLFSNSNLNSKSLRNTFFILILVFLIAFPMYERQQALIHIVDEKFFYLNFPNIFQPVIEDNLKFFYKEEEDLINNYMPEKDIMIISPDDTYLFYLTQKHNLLRANPQDIILTKDDLSFSLKNIVKICPKKIIVDCRLFKVCKTDLVTLREYPLTTHPRLMNEIQKTCNYKYTPTKCTNKLCVAEAKF